MNLSREYFRSRRGPVNSITQFSKQGLKAPYDQSVWSLWKGRSPRKDRDEPSQGLDGEWFRGVETGSVHSDDMMQDETMSTASRPKNISL